MAVITIIKQKGGVGSSTLSVLLFEVFKKKGVKKVCLIDCDPQQSITIFSQKIPRLNLVIGDLSDFKKLRKEYDLIIVDTPPTLDKNINKAITEVLPYSNLNILPVRPSAADVLSLQDVALLLKGIDKKYTSKSAILMNQVIKGNPYNSQIIDIVQGYGLPLFTSMLSTRLAFSRCLLNGGIYNEGNKKAIEEIEHVANEAYTLMTIKS